MATAVMMPRQGQSVESCVLVEWLVKKGDAVSVGTPLASIETDKAVFEIESQAEGTVLDLFFDQGADIPVLTNIAAIGRAGEDVAALRPGGAATAAEPSPAAAPAVSAPAAVAAAPAAGAPVGVSPRARSAAEKAGVNAQSLAGSGPGGRVIERDVQAAAAAGPRLSPAARAAAPAGAALPSSGTGLAGLVTAADLKTPPPAALSAVQAAPAAAKEVPFNKIRQIIADRMRKSLATTAQLTLTRSFDATTILALREKVKKGGEALGLPNITINDMIAFATARTLRKFPELNAHCVENKVILFPSVNLGVAMDTPRGLMVPVLRGADQISLSELSRRVKPMAEAARQGSISPDLLSGGTFTITNMGMLGIEAFTPILNAPEVAILGVGGLFLKPVASGDGVKHVQAITLSLTVDHQAVDGAPGARFLQALSAALESFDLSLAE